MLPIQNITRNFENCGSAGNIWLSHLTHRFFKAEKSRPPSWMRTGFNSFKSFLVPVSPPDISSRLSILSSPSTKVEGLPWPLMVTCFKAFPSFTNLGSLFTWLTSFQSKNCEDYIDIMKIETKKDWTNLFRFFGDQIIQLPQPASQMPSHLLGPWPAYRPRCTRNSFATIWRTCSRNLVAPLHPPVRQRPHCDHPLSRWRCITRWTWRWDVHRRDRQQLRNHPDRSAFGTWEVRRLHVYWETIRMKLPVENVVCYETIQCI